MDELLMIILYLLKRLQGEEIIIYNIYPIMKNMLWNVHAGLMTCGIICNDPGKQIQQFLQKVTQNWQYFLPFYISCKTSTKLDMQIFVAQSFFLFRIKTQGSFTLRIWNTNKVKQRVKGIFMSNYMTWNHTVKIPFHGF